MGWGSTYKMQSIHYSVSVNNLKNSTLIPQPSTLNPQPSTLNPQPEFFWNLKLCQGYFVEKTRDYLGEVIYYFFVAIFENGHIAADQGIF